MTHLPAHAGVGTHPLSCGIADTAKAAGFAILLWVAAAGGAVFAPPAVFQAILLLTGFCVLGVPHGILDIDLAIWAAPTRRRFIWLGSGLALYLGLIVLVGLGWMVAAGATLLTFLCTAIFHFGTEDAGGDEATIPPALRAALCVARGGAVVVVPLLTHASAVAPIFAVLAGRPVQEVASTIDVLRPLLTAGLVACAGLALSTLLQRRAWTKAAELGGVMILFAATPPLFAFAIYFCAVHALRHVAGMARRSGSVGRLAQTVWAITRLAPVACVFALLVCAALGLARAQNLDATSAAVIWSFRALAALTLPHLVLMPLLERRLARRQRHGRPA